MASRLVVGACNVYALALRLVRLVPDSSVSLLLGFSAMLSVSLVSRLTAIEVYTIMGLGVKRHLASGHEIRRSTVDYGSNSDLLES